MWKKLNLKAKILPNIDEVEEGNKNWKCLISSQSLFQAKKQVIIEESEEDIDGVKTFVQVLHSLV